MGRVPAYSADVLLQHSPTATASSANSAQAGSLICGGWGGGLIGLSSINGNDASENETTGFHQFKNKKWYAFRVRVDKKHITVWIDDKETIQVERENNKFSLRGEVFKSKPVGYCVFQSIVDIKEWEYQAVE